MGSSGRVVDVRLHIFLFRNGDRSWLAGWLVRLKHASIVSVRPDFVACRCQSQSQVT